MAFVSFAQNAEDLMLWRALRHIERGFWIDAGAADPDEWSVTRAFHDRGWTGINVEPSAHYFDRLRMARPLEINLRIALGAHAGSRPFHVVEDTGLSTFDDDLARSHSRAGFHVQPSTVEVCTLADICRWHAPAQIHFLKIDVEGAEAEVLAGADFTRFRPWIVLVEATVPLSDQRTEAEWEPILAGHGYKFVWFDGLNRFYVAPEHANLLVPAFATPPNHLDDWMLAADQVRRDRLAELAASLEAAKLIEARAIVERERAAAERERQRADIVASLAARDQALRAAEAAVTDAAWLRLSIEALREAASAPEPPKPESQPEPEPPEPEIVAQPPVLSRRRLMARVLLPVWRLIRPVARPIAWRVRGFMTAELRADLQRLVAQDRDEPAEEIADGVPGSSAELVRAGEIALTPVSGSLAPRRTVHQFHPSVSVGDAITNGMVLLRDRLRGLGFESEIFVQHRPDGMESIAWMLDDLPAHADYVLMVHHSFGYPDAALVADLAAPKVLVYHNITPAFFLDDPFLQSMAELGREQLALWRPLVAAAIADSAYNALELQRCGYLSAFACQTLFDPDALRAAALSAAVDPSERELFTVLFVGRVLPSKGQADLVDAYAAFRRRVADLPARLVLVGRVFGGGETYLAEIKRRIARHDLEDEIVVTMGVDDATLHSWYARAHIYASMSRHEGFGVPLAEAMAHRVPIAAVAAGAIPFTVGNAGILVEESDPERLADALVTLATDPDRRAAIIDAGRRQLERFEFGLQRPALLEALALAGASRPPCLDPAELARTMHITIAGHMNGNYSLAAVNRGFALALSDALPGRVSVSPIEGGNAARLIDVPRDEWDRLEALTSRQMPAAGPLVVVSQHYPVWVPDVAADLRVALFAWEESLVPGETVGCLNASFDAVLAPSRFVARALIDSGVTLPIRVVGHALRLEKLARRAEHQVPDLFTFLHVSSAFPRKGVDILLAAWVRAFGCHDRVRLVVKTFPNPHNDVARRIADLRALHPDSREIIHLDADLPDADLRALYEGADAMVLPSRGEGFNIPAAEAMAAGVPLIVSARGGHRDFIEPDDAILIGGRLAPSSSHVARTGSLWFEPDEDALVAAMRRVVDDRRAADAMAVRARTTVLHRLDRDGVTSRLVAILADLLARPSPPAASRIAVITSWGVRCGIAEYSALLIGGLPADLPRPIILADVRSEASSVGPTVVPSWEIGDRFDAGRLGHAIARHDPQILLIQHQPGLIAWSALAALLIDHRVRSRTVAITLHNTRDLEAMPEPERTGLLDALGGTARIIVHTAVDLDRLLGFGLDNGVMIPHGAIPAEDTRPLPTRLLLAGDAPLIGTYGFLLPPKGFGPLIEALKLVRQTWPRAKLRMVTAIYDEGPSEREHHALLDLAHTIGVGNEVDWHTGFLPRATSLELLRGCDLLVLPYRPTAEAASGALHTALASLVPTAVTPVEIFQEAGDAIARLPGHSPEAMAAGIVTLLQDTEQRRALRERQNAWLQGRSWTRTATRTAGMLQGLDTERRTAKPPATR